MQGCNANGDSQKQVDCKAVRCLSRWLFRTSSHEKNTRGHKTDAGTSSSAKPSALKHKAKPFQAQQARNPENLLAALKQKTRKPGAQFGTFNPGTLNP